MIFLNCQSLFNNFCTYFYHLHGILPRNDVFALTIILFPGILIFLRMDTFGTTIVPLNEKICHRNKCLKKIPQFFNNCQPLTKTQTITQQYQTGLSFTNSIWTQMGKSCF